MDSHFKNQSGPAPAAKPRQLLEEEQVASTGFLGSWLPAKDLEAESTGDELQLVWQLERALEMVW
jgi:hypothetical protein